MYGGVYRDSFYLLNFTILEARFWIVETLCASVLCVRIEI